MKLRAGRISVTCGQGARGGSATTQSGQNSCLWLNHFPSQQLRCALMIKGNSPLCTSQLPHLFRLWTFQARNCLFLCIYPICSTWGPQARFSCPGSVLHTVYNEEIHKKWNPKVLVTSHYYGTNSELGLVSLSERASKSQFLVQVSDDLLSTQITNELSLQITQQIILIHNSISLFFLYSSSPPSLLLPPQVTYYKDTHALHLLQYRTQ